MLNNKGSNMTTVKYQNRSLILNVLKSQGAISRVDIAQILNLTPAAITILVNEMVKEGIVVETGQLEEEDKRSGRKKILIDINYDFKYVIGINIETDFSYIGIANIKGEAIAQEIIATDKTIPPAVLLQGIAMKCLQLLWRENIHKDRVLGVGVGVVGKVDRTNGISKHAYSLWNEEVKVRDILEEALGLSITMDNNVRALALGELDYHTREEASNILFIKYGPGIGSAITINNEIYYGINSSAGEIGHTIVDINGEECKCKKRGCLETIASEKAMSKKIASEFNKSKTPALYSICQGKPENITTDNVYLAYESGDPYVTQLIKSALEYMALAVANAVIMYDPGKVILYGKVFRHQTIVDEFTAALEAMLSMGDLKDFIKLSKLNHKSSYSGAIALALREYFYSKGGI
ncbi:MAG: ROK family transcriptional regulator [Bacillota bacterium]